MIVGTMKKTAYFVKGKYHRKLNSAIELTCIRVNNKTKLKTFLIETLYFAITMFECSTYM